jgi:rhodanese-related sulfurtransferase
MALEFLEHTTIPTVRASSNDDLNGFYLIDVRRDDEFSGELGHIKGAVLATLGDDLQDHLKKLITDGKTNEKIIMICRSGARSSSATMLAQGLGFSKVYNLEGGMMGWNEQGLAVVR